jgi:Transposase IS116/IS110/IS902 family
MPLTPSCWPIWCAPTDTTTAPIAGDSADAEAIKVLARAHQRLIWTRTQHTNRLRSALREYYPAALQAFDDLAHGDALGVLHRAPAPEQGAHLPLTAIQSALKRGGRQRNIAARAREVQAVLRTEQLSAPAPVAAAFAATTRATVGIIAELNRQIAELETTLAEHFETHPDADIYLSQPGLGVVLGARVLGEFGDDPNRYTDAKSGKNYAGTSPLTVASGKKRAVLARHVRNRRLYDALDQWAFCALSTSPGARAFYDQHRAADDTHHQALRALGNRLVGILHGRLRHKAIYDEHTAWAHRTPAAA